MTFQRSTLSRPKEKGERMTDTKQVVGKCRICGEAESHTRHNTYQLGDHDFLPAPQPSSPPEGVLDAEISRWQQAIYELCRKHAIYPDGIDGGGCDSGDPLDLTLTEIGMLIEQLKHPEDYAQ